MQTYKIFEVEEKTTQSGKQLKKLVLQREGAQYPIKNVTIWGDHPLYDQAVPGGELSCEINETDSGTPNPNAPGKNYINRTVDNSGMSKGPDTDLMALKTQMDQWGQAIMNDLKVLREKLGVDSQGKDYPYPSKEGIDPAKTFVDGTGTPELTNEDVPF